MAVRKGSHGVSGGQGQGSVEEASGCAVQCDDWTAPVLGSAGGLFSLICGSSVHRRAPGCVRFGLLQPIRARRDETRLSRNERLTTAAKDAQHPARTRVKVSRAVCKVPLLGVRPFVFRSLLARSLVPYPYHASARARHGNQKTALERIKFEGMGRTPGGFGMLITPVLERPGLALPTNSRTLVPALDPASASSV